MGKMSFCKKLAWGALTILVLIGLVSCGGQPQPAPSEKPATGEQPAATQAAQPAQSEEKPVTIAIPEDPLNFNGAVGDQGYDALVMHLVLLGMTGVDPDGNVYPQLAAELPSVENGGVVENADAGKMDVTWKMRKDVVWADGQPVTADDVIFTYEAIVNPETGGWINGIDYVEGVEKIDDYSFIVHFNAIYPAYLTLFGGEQVAIWPKHYCSAEQGFTAWDCARKPLSNGPYILEEWVTGDHLTFVRNPKYYEAGKPEIEKIVVRIVPDVAVRENMIKQGDADVLMWATEQVLDNLKTASNVKLSISPTSRFVMRLFINLAAKGSTDPAAKPNPYFSDVRVRQAMRMAIDVDAISSTVWHGFAKPIWTEFFREPYVCNIPRPKYDPVGAKALLDEAGWVDDGSGVRKCKGCQTAEDGTPLSMEMITYAEYGEPLELSQQLIGEMLAAVGIQTKLSIVQGSVLWAAAADGGIEQNGDFDIDLYDDGYAGVDPTDFIWQYYYSEAAQPDYGWNIGRWSSAEFDALLDEAYTLDEARRKEVFCQMAEMLDKELPQILLFSTINADAHSDRLSGIQSNINNVVSWNVADWKLVK